MPCSWEGNRRSGVALHGRASQTSDPPTSSRPKKGRWAPRLHSSWGMAHFTFTFYGTRITRLPALELQVQVQESGIQSSIQTAGLAFGSTGLCSYRVRGVDGSCAEHLTVESYTVFICQQSYLLLFGIPSPTHPFIPGLKPSFSAKPSHCSPSFLLLKYSLRGFPDCLLLFLSISVFYF